MNIKRLLDARGPAILTVVGIAAFGSAVYLTAKAAPVAKDILDEMPDADRVEKIKAVAPVYAPVAGAMLLGTGAILASQHILNARYTSILALYSATDAALTRWQDSTLETVSKKKFEEIRREVVKPREDIPDNMGLEEGQVLFYDDWTQKYFGAASVEVIRKAVNDINATALDEDFAPLNDFYYALGLPPLPNGDNIGWGHGGHKLEVDFIPYLRDDGKTPIVISFRVRPKPYSETQY